MTKLCECGHIKTLHQPFHYYHGKRVNYGKCSQCECKEFKLKKKKQ